MSLTWGRYPQHVTTSKPNWSTKGRSTCPPPFPCKQNETREMTVPSLPRGQLWELRAALRPDLSVPFSTSCPHPNKGPGLRDPGTEPVSSESTSQDTHSFPGEAPEDAQRSDHTVSKRGGKIHPITHQERTAFSGQFSICHLWKINCCTCK